MRSIIESDGDVKEVRKKNPANLLGELKKRSEEKVVIMIGKLICVQCAASQSVSRPALCTT